MEKPTIFKKSLKLYDTKINAGIQVSLKVDGKFEDIIDQITETATFNNSKLIFFTSIS